MKILYAIQGTGNGHLSRSMDIVPLLKQMAEVDVLVSGTQGDLVLPFPVKYNFNGFGFIFGKSGGVDLWKSFYKSRFRNFIKEINKQVSSGQTGGGGSPKINIGEVLVQQ